jgi:hypothetical protein
MKATIGAGTQTLGTIEWAGDQYKVTGLSRAFLSRQIPVIEEHLGVSGPTMLERLPDYFSGGDKWVKLEP